APATAQLAGDHPAVSGQHAEPGEPGEPWRPGRHAEPGEPWRPGWLAGFTSGRRRPSVTLIALVVVVAIAVSGGVAYLVAGRHPGSSAAARGGTSVHGKPAVRMLAAGRTGSRSAIPWSLIGAGWTLAEVSTAPAGPDPTAAGSVTTYLVDPEGGRYQIQTSTGPAPLLLAWSGNARSALFAVPPGPSGTGVTYDLLSLTTGDMSALPLPPGVTAAGFTRPDGLNILAVSQTATAFQLERFNLQGGYQATIGSLPRKPGMVPWQANCSVACGALSSPDGLTAVWGIAGAQMQLLGNAGGPVIRRLDVPDSGSPPSCVPLTWWNAATVLAYCSVTGHPHAGRLWLVPTDGTSPTAVTGASGSGSGAGVVVGAWQLAGRTYVNSTNFAQCAGAPSGPGGLAVATVSGGSLPPVSIRGTTNNHTTVVSASDGKLLVLAQTSCPSSSSLLWLSPSTGATLTVLSAAASQAGVIAAVPYGNGPTAISAG
ncbi:MAG: hypothetical protein ACRDOK_28725, partial [Streptosporangiaceae bacterium]